MSTLVPDKRHPALDVAESERVDYLVAAASMAFADKSADDTELARVESLCDSLEVSGAGRERVLAASKAPDRDEVADILERLANSELKFALMVDAIDIAYADDEIVPAEAAEIDALAAKLGIERAQVAMLRRYVEARTSHELDNEENNKEVAAGLASAGIPAAGLAVATTLGAPILAGAGVAAALGVGSYVGVRWLLRRARRKRTEDGNIAAIAEASESTEAGGGDQ